MGGFLKSAPGKPIEPTLDVYELDSREPCLRIDQQGQVYLHQHPKEQLNKEEIGLPIRPAFNLPLILFADVSVMIPTSFGFTLAPMRYANEDTGPPREPRCRDHIVIYDDELHCERQEGHIGPHSSGDWAWPHSA